VTADSSVLVAAFASWHDRHAQAVKAVRGVTTLVAHAELEAYSVLTRLPAPFRAAAADAAVYLDQYGGERLVLDGAARGALVADLAEAGLTGGQVYDALIARTAKAHDLTLLTCDTRAQPTYRALGASVLAI
jgi:predicted nucleic acid-binding protein